MVQNELKKMKDTNNNTTPIKASLATAAYDDDLTPRDEAFRTPPPCLKPYHQHQSTSATKADGDSQELTPIGPLFSSARIGYMKQMLSDHRVHSDYTTHKLDES